MKKLLFLLILSLLVLSPQIISAQTPDSSEAARRAPKELREVRQLIQEKREQIKENREEKIAEKKTELAENAKERLDERRLKICQAKEKTIQERTSGLDRLSTNILAKFDTIAQRTQTFYTEKLVPQGKTIENYDALVSDVSVKKEVALSAVAAVQEDSTEFKCDGEDPKGELLAFREDMQAVKAALGEYRTSIKNLIVAVKSAAGEESSAE